MTCISDNAENLSDRAARLLAAGIHQTSTQVREGDNVSETLLTHSNLLLFSVHDRLVR